MAHLASFRQGWRGENLASYLLSRFSFVARPSTVSDDIGSDFFCTLFEGVDEGGHEYLFPLNSLAIQIKSNRKNIDASNKIGYLLNLELPFLVGVISQQKLALTFYSGEVLPLVFSHYGIPDRLTIELIEAPPESIQGYYERQEASHFVVRFPKVGTIDVRMTQPETSALTTRLGEICAAIHRSIASKSNGEYIFDLTRLAPPQVSIFAGIGSARVFRANFLKRLAEVFYNLEWTFRQDPQTFPSHEFEIFEQLMIALRNEYGALPSYVEEAYHTVKGSVGEHRGTAATTQGGASLRFDPVTESIVQDVLRLAPKQRNDVLSHVHGLLNQQG